jgi:hypothetical protein
MERAGSSETTLTTYQGIRSHKPSTKGDEKQKKIISSSGLLRGVRWFEIDVSGIHTGLIFKGQAVQEEASLTA